MARKVSQSDPALAIEFFLSGFYTHRSQLFAPFKGIGVNVVSFHDPIIDGRNMEITDLFEVSRRPGFSIFCPTPLNDLEVVNQFYGARNLAGTVLAFFDSTQRLATFTDTGITPVITKTTEEQGYVSVVGNMTYFSDGVGVDMQKWYSVGAFSTINPSPWGIPAPILIPSIFNRGCWLPFTNFVSGNAILDPNGNVEVVTAIFGGSGVSGGNEPLWPTTVAATISDGSIQWTNDGPLQTWLPATFYPVPVVILDTNGNLQLATATSPVVLAWDSGTTYAVGVTVSFAGEFWTSLVASTNQPPSSNTTVTTTSGSTSTTQPFWVPASNPSQTGTYPTTPFTPTWNTTIGGTTVDGNYTWTNLGPGNLVESFGTSYVYCYRTIYGHLSTASPVSINTGSIFGPVVATITSFSITNGVVTFTGVNNFIPGNVFTVQGLSVGTYLNNQAFTIISAGLSPTSFSALFTTANVSNTVDSGSTLNLIATVTGVGSPSPLCNSVAAINSSEVQDGVVTLFGPNNFVPGLQITLTGLTVASFLNELQFEVVNVDPLGQWFQIFFTTPSGTIPPNQVQTTDTGIATFNSVEIYRTSDGGGIYLFTGAVTNPTGEIVIPFDSGISTTGLGVDNGVPGTHVWANPDNVTGDTAYATVSIPTPTGGGGSARFNPVQVCQNMAANQIGPSTVVASFPVNVTASNTILLFVDTFQLTSWSVSDTQGNNYVQIAQHQSPNANGIITTTVYRAQNVSGGPTTVKLAIVPQTGTSHQDFAGFAAVECSGLNGTIDGTNGNFAANGVTFQTGSITTTGPNSVVFSFGAFDLGTHSSLPATPPAGFTRIANQVVFDAPNGNSYQQMSVAYQVQTAIGTFDPKWNTPANNKLVGVTVGLDLSLFAPSDGLNSTEFDFSVPPSITISGIEVSFDALFSGTVNFGILDVQLLKAGVPVGLVMQVFPTNSNVGYVLGGVGNLWGATWMPADFNSPDWGVQITATQLTGGTDAVFSVRNVQARLTGSTSTSGWVFNDFTTDEDLDILLIAPQNHLNDPPPGAPGSSISNQQGVGTITTYWQGRLWMAVGNYVYFDAGPDCTNGVPEEAWPPANRFQFAGPVIGLAPTPDGVGLLVYLADRVAAILGGPETISFYPTDALSNFGISSPNALFRDGSIIGQFTTQKQYFELVGNNKQEIGEHIADYLTDHFNPEDAYVTLHRDGLDVGVFISNGSDQILRFGTNINAWSVPCFPIGGAGALRSIETSIGTYSLMLAPAIGGVASSTVPTNPQVGVSIGSGTTPWVNPGNITVGNPTDYASLTTISVVSSQSLQASGYPLNIPSTAVITGILVSVTGKEIPPTPSKSIIETPTNSATGSVTSLTITMVEPVEIGDTILIYVCTGINSAFLTTASDNLGNDYAVNNIDAGANGSFFEYSVVSGFSGSGGVVTILWTDAQPFASAILLHGRGLTTRDQQGLQSYPIPVNPNATQSILTSFPTELLIAVGCSESSFALLSQSPVDAGIDGFTPLVTFKQLTVSTKLVSSIGTFQDDFNVDTSQQFGAWIVSYDPPPLSFVITPINPAAGAESDSGSFGTSNTTVVFGGPTDLWGMPWISPAIVNAPTFGFDLSVPNGDGTEFFVSEVQVTVFYQNPGNFLLARDLNSWGDNGQFGENNGTSYDSCFITVGSITLSQPGAPMFPLQHVVGYFDAAGTLNNGAPSQPTIWIMPNEISADAGIGFVELPEVLQEPPQGQNHPSASLLSLRWPVNMLNSNLASQFIRHLQVKIQFEPENAPNTIKAIAFKENQD